METQKTSARTRSRFFPLVWALPVAAVVLVAAVLIARWIVGTDGGQSFLERYPGESAVPSGTPGGFAWWVQVQHAANFLFMVLIIRSGYLVHAQRRPDAYWTRNNKGRFKTAGSPKKMSIYLWLHLSMDSLWVLNGVIFGVLIFVTGAWKRIIPVHWDIFPNAISAALQYLSLDWPINEPWTNYNSLQVLAYFVTIFIAAPIAAVTGFRMSPVWRETWRMSKIFPVQLARLLHFPVMIYFVGFIVVHVALVFSTGMRLNLAVMYANGSQGSETWWGLIVFLVVLLAAVAAWVAARPMFMAPVASMTGRVSQR